MKYLGKDFACPKCGHKEFKTLTEIKGHLDFIDAICLKCRYVITGNDIKELINKVKNEILEFFQKIKT